MFYLMHGEGNEKTQEERKIQQREKPSLVALPSLI